MEIALLTRRQFLHIYFTAYQKDFPRSERKPLTLLLRGIRSGLLQCYGLFEDGRLRAYAILIRQLDAQPGQPGGCLLDYLATLSGQRSRGCGSTFLGLLRAKLPGAACLLAEVEDPDFTEDDDERAVRERRIRFYDRNGFADTGMRVKLFGTNYRVLELRLDGVSDAPHDAQTLGVIYHSIYRSFLPALQYQQNVHIL